MSWGQKKKRPEPILALDALDYSFIELLLSCFKAGVGLADYVYSAFAADYLAIWVPLLSGAEAGEYLHRFIRRRVYQ